MSTQSVPFLLRCHLNETEPAVPDCSTTFVLENKTPGDVLVAHNAAGAVKVYLLFNKHLFLVLSNA